MRITETHAGERDPLVVTLNWTGDLKFRGESGQVVQMLDSHGKDGTSPMQALAFALAGCMGMDLVHLLTKARTPFTGVQATLTARRPSEPPSRFIAVTLHFVIDGEVPDAQVARAIQLSRDKYLLRVELDASGHRLSGDVRRATTRGAASAVTPT